MTTPQYPGRQPPAWPPPPVAPRKSNALKIVLILLAAVVILCVGIGVLVALVGSAGSNTHASSSPGGSARHATLGQPARDGKFEFTVTKVDCGATKVGDEILGETAQGQFCLVTVSVKNIGDRPQTFNGSDQKARNAAGVTYGNDTKAELVANSSTQTFLQDINPGNQVTGVLVFDIPKTEKLASLELHDSPFSGGVIVTLP